MTQPTFVLSPPLLLATDGSSGAHMAQTMVRPIAELLQALQASQENATPTAVLTVVTVQPRPRKRVTRSLKLVGKKPAGQPADADSSATDPALAGSAPEGATTGAGGAAGLSLDQLTKLVQADFPSDFPLSVQVRQGQPATEILNCARTIGASLIVVGHRGVGGVRELLLGSVSTAIARYAPCSVLIARTRNHSVAVGLGHVLLVVDATFHDQQAFAMTRQLAPAGIHTITLLHIQPPLNASYLVAPFTPRTPSWQLTQSLQEAQREQGEQILQTATTALAIPDLTVQTQLHTGDTGPSICQVAEAIGANLIMMGSDPTRRSLLAPLQAMRQSHQNRSAVRETADQPRPILRNTRLSVTEDYVIHYAPCPVLLCRATVATP
ncbi:MAG: universal stress protein [Leptolyngbyaceae cyanobacterium bins.349]|nr:universal stress protein [Leptolyngbyaceae cyanobacterium bins.349]